MARQEGTRDPVGPGPGWLASGCLHRSDLAEYYRRVFGRIAPFMEDRRVSAGRGRDVIEVTAQTLVEDALLGHVEVTGARCTRLWPRHPTRLTFDVESKSPADPRGAREATLLLGELLERVGLESFVKTSGDRGYHVWVPVLARDGPGAIIDFQLQMVLYLVGKAPGLIDGSLGYAAVWLMPAPAETSTQAILPYSARALEGYPVSVPLDWGEMRRQVIDPRRYNIKNVFQRLAQKIDPWKAWGDIRQSLDAPRRELSRLMGRPARVD